MEAVMNSVVMAGVLGAAVISASVCRAEVPAGDAASSSGDPHELAEVPAPLHRRSTGLMAGGIVMVSIGSIATIIGAAALIGQQQSEQTCHTSSDLIVSTGGYPLDCEEEPGTTIAGASLLAGGLAVVAGGVPMIVIGKQLVPDSPVATLSIAPRRAGASLGFSLNF
jgi:hypothetical protein